MKYSGKQIRRALIVSILFILFVFANFYTVRKMIVCGVQAYFYDKMLVAYRVGGARGLNGELERVFSGDKNLQEREVAVKFKGNLSGLKSPEEFLEEKVNEKKNMIHRMRTMREVSFGIIVFFLLLRVALDRIEKR